MPPSFEDRLSEILTEHTRPRRVEVIKAKHLIGKKLSDGKLCGTRGLLQLLVEAEGVDVTAEERVRLGLPNVTDDPGELVRVDHPWVRWHRYEAASYEALAELSAAGLIVPLGGPYYRAPDTKPRLRVEHPGGSFGVNYDSPRPCPAAEVFRLTHRLIERGAWGLDADLFLADLTGLGLDARTERCIREAIEAYRRELYVACTALLGAASEGAWHAAAALLGPIDRGVAKAIGDGKGTAGIQTAVVNAVTPLVSRDRKWEVNDLATHGELLRELRNYGVHGKAGGPAGLEDFFEEERCGLLLLTTHRHLRRLAEIVSEVIATAAAAPAGPPVSA